MGWLRNPFPPTGKVSMEAVHSRATDEQIQAVMFRIGDVNSCTTCGTALRYGDYECPHCGTDLEDHLRQWARDLVDEVLAAGRG